MLRRGLPLLLLLPLGLLCGCQSQFDNPFADLTRTAPPRTGSDLIFASNLHKTPGAARELFALDDDGGNLTQLTFCDETRRPCDTLEGSAAPDRQRVIVRRSRDANSDGRLDPGDGPVLLFVDLTRGAEAPLVPATAQVSGIDWSPTGDVLVYAALGDGDLEDLWRADPNGANNRNLTASSGIRERRPRVDPTGSVAVFERIAAGEKSKIHVFLDRLRQVKITDGGPGTGALAGTPYLIGSDADPDFSPDGRLIVFRRLTAEGASDRGLWDVLTVRSDGTGVVLVSAGSAWRGPPDWGPSGIVFEEVDAQTGTHRLVVVQPDGTGRRVILTAAAGSDLSFPRWLP